MRKVSTFFINTNLSSPQVHLTLTFDYSFFRVKNAAGWVKNMYICIPL